MLLALPLFLLLLMVIRVDHNPFVAEVVDYTVQNDEIIDIYSCQDINNDGISEKLQIYNLPTNATIIGYNQNGTIFESWNLYGKYYFNNPVFNFHDIDEDGIQEIYAITITPDDSVFVNQTELRARSGDYRKKFVTKLGRYRDQLDAVIEGLGFSDITGDSVPDYLFVISAGFTLQPRAVYAWDIIKDQVLRSPFAGMNVKYPNGLISADLNNDNIREIFLPTWSTDNYNTTVPFSDTASYSLVLTKNLEHLYLPVLVAGPSSISNSFPLTINDTTHILTIARMVRGESNDGLAVLFDAEGNKEDSILLKSMNTQTSYEYVNGRIIFTAPHKSGTVIGTIENDLSMKEHVNIPGTSLGTFPADLDNDPEMEIILLDTKEGMLHILQDNLKTLTTCTIPTELSYLLHISISSRRDNETRFLVQMKDYRMMIIYRANPFYKWRFSYYFLLYGIICLVLFLLQKAFVFRSNRRKTAENRMINLQLQSVMNQLNPHFTFNALNTVGDSILSDRKHEAYENLTKLSELIRSSMINAFQVYKPLGEEVEFTKQYLELEAVRFDGKLTYAFNIDSNVDMAMKVPKMLIHIFVENAIKHGIFHKTTAGHIEVTATRNNKATVITISDDGIGRRKARTISGDKGKGLHILNEYLVLFRKNYHRVISYTIEDLYNRKKDSGTIVTILIDD